MNKAIIKDIRIDGGDTYGFIDTFESEGVLYSDCAIVNTTVFIRMNSVPFQRCYFENCEIKTEAGSIHGLGGQNFISNSKINGEFKEDFRTY
ncbi:MAG: hypothetical protein Tp1111DCM1126091_85 [Prokaryotic dsDNA virus sp.]|nr:MAG: hypothetical protein Tp1111DCM1126091_85 [Prokaryotic dsDNA virus sp.]|tara:strand:- start:62266 stop:62541 length:276 start_codon:yes stop_codon:yes gene_type:complete